MPQLPNSEHLILADTKSDVYKRQEIIKPENLVYKKPTLMNDNAMHYCPGCSHGVVHILIAEVIEEMGMEDVYKRHGYTKVN